MHECTHEDSCFEGKISGQ